MVTLFDEEWIAKMHEKEVLEIGREEGRAQGWEQGVLSTIQNMIKSFGLTVEQAVAGAGIPEDEQQKYI